MRFTDIMMAFPTLLLAMTLTAILKPSMWIIIVVIGLVYWTWIARVVYGQVVSLRYRDFVMASRAVGAKRGYTLTRHILPQLTSHHHRLEHARHRDERDAGGQLELPGNRRAAAHAKLGRHDPAGPVVLPRGALVGDLPRSDDHDHHFSFNLLGDGLRDALDPTQRGRF